MGIQNSVLAAFGAVSGAVVAGAKSFKDNVPEAESEEAETRKAPEEPSEKTKRLEDMKKKSRDSLSAARTTAERKRKIREAVLSQVARSEEEE